jgi:hypothetical protein
MVLGSSAVAFAASPSSDTYANAKTVLKKGDKFVQEENEQEAAYKQVITSKKGANLIDETWQIAGDLSSYKRTTDANGNAAWALYVGRDVNRDFVHTTSGNVTTYTTSTGKTAATVTKTTTGGTVNYTVDWKYKNASTVSYGASDLIDNATNVAGAADSSLTVPSSLQTGTTNPSLTTIMVAVTGSDNKNYNLIGVASTYDDAAGTTFMADKIDSGAHATSTASKVYILSSTGEVIATTSVTIPAGTKATDTLDLTAATLTYENTKPYAGSGDKYTVNDLVLNGNGIYDYSLTDEGNLYYVTGAGTASQTRYAIDDDGYVMELTQSRTSFTPNAKAISRSSSSDEYLIVFKQLDADNQAALLDTAAYALDDSTLSKDAVAVQYDIYKLIADKEVANTTTKAKTAHLVDSVSDSVTITLTADTLSRTGLKAAAGIQVYAPDYSDSYKKDSNTLYRLADLGTADVSGSFSFDIRDFRDHVLIFDGAAEESNNDGVSDTTTAATAADSASTPASSTAASSPKTGDVAPIAALAVVMMGACGAMVVASKKRA